MRGRTFLTGIWVLLMLLPGFAPALTAGSPTATEASDPALPGPVLSRLFGNLSFSPAPDARELLKEAARAMDLAVEQVTFTPVLDPTRPLANALQQWVLATNAAVPDADLAEQLLRADALPLDLQRSLATVILATLEARRLEQIALSPLSDEERAFVNLHRGSLVDAPDSPEARRLQEIAAKVDLAKSVEAALLLLSVLDREEATLQSWSARLSGGNEAQLVTAVVEPHLPLLRAGGLATAERLALAEQIVARAAGYETLPRPQVPKLDDEHPLAVALAELAGAFGLSPSPDVLAEIAAADALPIDLQRAIATIVHAKAEALLAESTAHLPGVTPTEAAALSVKAQLNLLAAVTETAPVLQFWSELLDRLPTAHRLAALNAAFRGPLAVLEAKGLASRDLAPADALRQALAVRGLDVASAPVPALTPGEALQRLYEAEGRAVHPDMARGIDEAVLHQMDPTLAAALTDLLSALAFADAETRAALAPLTLAERDRLRDDAPVAEALLAEARGFTAEERAFLLDHVRLADKADFPRLAQAAVTLAETAADAQARLAARLAPPPATASGPGLAFLSALAALSPIGSARAQSSAPGITCFGTAFSDCGDDLYFQDPAGLVSVTGQGSSLLLGRHVLVIDLGGSDGHLGNAGGADGGQQLSPVSLVLEMGGKDQYETASRLSQGAASFGIGMVLDYGPESDVFNAQNQVQGYGYFGVGVLFNEGGDDRYTAFQDAQGRGAGLASPGIGLLLDRQGNDRYQASRAQGFGFGGVLVDAGGRDTYAPESTSLGVPITSPPLLAGRADNALWLNGPSRATGDVGLALDFDPQEHDLDRDQWPDLFERLVGSNPRDPLDTPDKGLARAGAARTADADRDGMADDAERAVGTNPNDAHDHFLAVPSIPAYPPGTPLPVLNQVLGMAPREFATGWNDNRQTAQNLITERNVTYARGFILNVGLPDLAPVDQRVTVPAILRVNPNATVGFEARAVNSSGGDGRSTGAGTTVDPDADEQKDPAPATSGVSEDVNEVAPGADPLSESTVAFELDHPVRLFALGDTVPTLWRSEYLVSIDLGGADLYRNAPGGAIQANLTFNENVLTEDVDVSAEAPERLIFIPTLHVDASGHDLYDARVVKNATGVLRPLSGQGSMGGILADLEGNDVYIAGPNSQGAAGNPNPAHRAGDVNAPTSAAGILLDVDGIDRYDARDDSQGSGGFLLDLGPQGDRYLAGNRSQGYGGPRPYAPKEWTDYGLLLDLGGDDRYDTATRVGSRSQGVAGPGSVGLLLDLGGTDTYHAFGFLTQGVLLPAPEHDYRRLAQNVQEDVPAQKPLASAPNPRRLRAGPAVAVHLDLEGSDTYLVTSPAKGGGLVTTPLSAARNNHLDVERTPATIRVGAEAGALSRSLYPPSITAYWNLALRADTTTEENLDGEGGVTAWLGSDPTDADDGGAGAALQGFLVNLPLAGLAIGATEPTSYLVPYALTIDLGGRDRYANDAAGPFGLPLAAASNMTLPLDPTGASRDWTNASEHPVTLALDFGGDADIWQAVRGGSLGTGLFTVGIALDDGGANLWNGTVPAVAHRAVAATTNLTEVSLHNLTTRGRLLDSHWTGSLGQRFDLVSGDGLITLPVEVRAMHDGRNLTLALLVPDRTPIPAAGGDRVRVLFDGTHDHAFGAGDDGLDLTDRVVDLQYRDGAWTEDEARFQDATGARHHNTTLKCAGATTPGCWIYQVTKPYTNLDPRDFLLAEGETLAFAIEVVDTGPGTLREYGAPKQLEAWPTLTLLAPGNDRVPDHYHLLPATQGHAVAGVGLLLATGTSRSRDQHLAGDRSLGYAGVNGIGLVLDAGGSDRYDSGRLGQGATTETQLTGAVAALIDLSGNDVYLAEAASLGHRTSNSAQGAAAFLDVTGDDYYRYGDHARQVKTYPADGRTFPPSHLNGWGWVQPAGDGSGNVPAAGLDLDTVDRALALVGGIHVTQSLCHGETAGLRALEAAVTGNPGYQAAGGVTYALLGNDLTFVSDQVCPAAPRARDSRTTHALVTVREATATGCGASIAPPANESPLVKGTVCLTAVTDLPNIDGRPPAVERVDFILRSLDSEPGLPLGTGVRDADGTFTLRWDSTRFAGAPLGDGHYGILPRVYLDTDANPELDRAVPDAKGPAWSAGAYYEDGVPLDVRLDNKPLVTGLAVVPSFYSRFSPATADGRAELSFDLTRDLQEDLLSGGGLETEPALRRLPCSGNPTRLCDRFPLYFLPFDQQGYLDGVFEEPTTGIFRFPVTPPDTGEVRLRENPSPYVTAPVICLADTLAKPLVAEATIPPAPGGKIPTTPFFGWHPTRFRVQDPIGSTNRLIENVTFTVGDTQRFAADVTKLVGEVTNGYVTGIAVPFALAKVANLTGIASRFVSDGSCFVSDLESAATYLAKGPALVKDPPYVGNYTGRISTAPPAGDAPTVYLLEHGAKVDFTLSERLDDPFVLGPDRGRDEQGRLIAPLTLRLDRNPLVAGDHTTVVTLWETWFVPDVNGGVKALRTPVASQRANHTFEAGGLPLPLARVATGSAGVPGYRDLTGRSFNDENPLRAPSPFKTLPQCQTPGSTNPACRGNGTIGSFVRTNLEVLGGNTAQGLVNGYKLAEGVLYHQFNETARRVDDDVTLVGGISPEPIEGWDRFTRLSYLPGRENYQFHENAALTVTIQTFPPPAEAGPAAPPTAEELWVGAREYAGHLSLEALTPTVAANTVSARLTSRDGSGTPFPLLLETGNGAESLSVKITGGTYGPASDKHVYWSGHYRNPFTDRRDAVPDGDYLFEVTVVDATGATTVTRSFVTVDTEAPVTRVSLPRWSGIDATPGNALTLTWKGDDLAGSGVSHYRAKMAREPGLPVSLWSDLKPDGAIATAADGPEKLVIKGTTLRIPLDPSKGRDYQFLVVAVDRAGNIETPIGGSATSLEEAFQYKLAEGPIATTLDLFRPDLLSSVAYRAPDSVEALRRAGPATRGLIEACVRDPSPGSGVASVTLKAFMDVPGAAPLANAHPLRATGESCLTGQKYVFSDWASFMGDKARYPPGTWSYYVSVLDRAGNEARSEEERLAIDNDGPRLDARVVYPEGQSAAKLGDTLQVLVKATDQGGVRDRDLRLDATAVNRTLAVDAKRPTSLDGELAYAITFTVDRVAPDGLIALPLAAVDDVGNPTERDVLVLIANALAAVPEEAGTLTASHNAVTLAWRTRDEATALVRYGRDPFKLDRTATNGTLGTHHTVNLTDLAPATTYYYRAVSVSPAGKITESPLLGTFNTSSSLAVTLLSPTPEAPAGRDLAIRWTGGHPDGLPVRYDVSLGVPDLFRTRVATLTERGDVHEVRLNASVFQDRPDYVIILTAVTGDDRVELVSPPFDLDATSPRLFGEAPLRATRDTRPLITVHAADGMTGLDAAAATLRIDGRPVLANLTFDGDLLTATLLENLTEGVHTVRVTIPDRAGNPGILEWPLAVDRTAPQLRDALLRFTPGPKNAAPGATGTVSVVAADLTPLARVTASIPGVPAPVLLAATDGYHLGAFTVPASTPEGLHTIVLAAEDEAGNRATLPVTFTADATAPKVTGLQALARGHREATLLAMANEPVTFTLSYSRDGPGAVLDGPAKAATTARIPLAGLLPSAKYVVEVTARDEAGNAATARHTFATLDDLVAPTRVIEAVLRDAGDGRLSLTWDAADDDVGLAGYRIYRERDGTFVPLATVPGLDYEDGGLTLETPYTYRVAAVDLAGNVGEPSPPVTGVSSAVPVLLDGAVTPDAGTKGDLYTYRVTYRNGGGTAPAEVRVIINGIPHAMRAEKGEPTAEDYRGGVAYVYETALPPHTLGHPHTYRFDASDGRYRIAFGPETGLKGPRVADVAPLGEVDDGPFGIGGFVRGMPGFEALFALVALTLSVALIALRRRESK